MNVTQPHTIVHRLLSPAGRVAKEWSPGWWGQLDHADVVQLADASGCKRPMTAIVATCRKCCVVLEPDYRYTLSGAPRLGGEGALARDLLVGQGRLAARVLPRRPQRRPDRLQL